MRSIESNKQLYPWSQFIVDSNGLARKARQLDEGSSAIVVLYAKDGRVQWAKDGALASKVQQVVGLLHKLPINRDAEAGVEEGFTRRVVEGLPCQS